MSKFKKITNISLFSIGLTLLLFDVYFFVTAIDELYNNGKVWVYGIGILGLIGTIGISSIAISLDNNNKIKNIFLYLIIAFITVALLGFFIS